MSKYVSVRNIPYAGLELQKYEFTGKLSSKAFEDDTVVRAFFFLGIRASGTYHG